MVCRETNFLLQGNKIFSSPNNNFKRGKNEALRTGKAETRKTALLAAGEAYKPTF